MHALGHSRRDYWWFLFLRNGSYFWQIEHSDLQFSSMCLCKSIQLSSICFSEMVLHFWIGPKPFKSWSEFFITLHKTQCDIKMVQVDITLRLLLRMATFSCMEAKKKIILLSFRFPRMWYLGYGGQGVCNKFENQSSLFNLYFVSFRKTIILKIWFLFTHLCDTCQHNIVCYSLY